LTFKAKICRVWRWTPVIPAIQAGEQEDQELEATGGVAQLVKSACLNGNNSFFVFVFGSTGV
jgi:hypothetical protein